MSAFPPGGPAINNVIPAYPYIQYSDDDGVQAFFIAYNAYAQAYLDYLNNLNLPIYTSNLIAGPLLDWVALGIYGFLRPVFVTTGQPPRGPLDTWQLNTLPLNTYLPGTPSTYTLATDDIFKRVLTWHLYQGDGKVFDVQWLKRRIGRFFYGVNGTDPVVNPYAIGVEFTSAYKATLTLPGGPIAAIFSQAIAQGVLELPFQMTWTINQNNIPPNAILDRDGNPILDRDGNYILSR